MKKLNKKFHNNEELSHLIEIKTWKNYKIKFIKIHFGNKNLILFIISLFIYFISYFLYYLSLEKCTDGFDQCGIKNKWILTKLIEAISSSIILSFLIEAIIFKIISKFHFLHIIIIHSFLFKYSHGIDFHDHGFFNFIGSFIIIFLNLLILTPLNILIKYL